MVLGAWIAWAGWLDCIGEDGARRMDNDLFGQEIVYDTWLNFVFGTYIV